MISTFFISTAYYLLNGVISFLPVGTLPPALSNALVYVFGAVNAWSYIIAVASLFGALGIVLVYEGLLWSYFALLWIYKHIPFIGR